MQQFISILRTSVSRRRRRRSATEGLFVSGAETAAEFFRWADWRVAESRVPLRDRAPGPCSCPAARLRRHRGSLVARPGRMPAEAAGARRLPAAGESTRPARVGTAMRRILQSFSYSFGTSSDGLDVPPVLRRDAPLCKPRVAGSVARALQALPAAGNGAAQLADTIDDRSSPRPATRLKPAEDKGKRETPGGRRWRARAGRTTGTAKGREPRWKGPSR